MVSLTAFSKCFLGEGYMKVGGGLCSEGTLSSALRLHACSRVSEYHSLEIPWKFSMLKDEQQILACSFFIKLTTCRATNLLVPWQINQSARRISSTRN